MVESENGLNRLDEIARTQVLTGTFVGPADLSLSVDGTPSLGFDEDQQLDRLRRIKPACADAGVISHIFADSADAARTVHAIGYHFVAVHPDALCLAANARQILAELRGDTLSQSPLHLN
jgi:4-hydroxy-2-oxoheptanedioate aldolase